MKPIGLLELLVLAALDQQGRSPGLAIHKKITSYWPQPMDRTQVYRSLGMLKKKRYVARHKEKRLTGASDNKFSFSITDKGKQKLEETLTALDGIRAKPEAFAKAS